MIQEAFDELREPAPYLKRGECEFTNHKLALLKMHYEITNTIKDITKTSPINEEYLTECKMKLKALDSAIFFTEKIHEKCQDITQRLKTLAYRLKNETKTCIETEKKLRDNLSSSTNLYSFLCKDFSDAIERKNIVFSKTANLIKIAVEYYNMDLGWLWEDDEFTKIYNTNSCDISEVTKGGG